MQLLNRFIVIILLLFPLLPPAVLSAEPLKSHNMHPLYTALAQFQPRKAAIQTPHSAGLYLIQSYGNNFFLDTETGGDRDIVADLDSEAAYTSLGVRYGFGTRIDAYAVVLVTSHFPGVLDGFLQWYHGLFGFPNADRDLRPDYALNFYLKNRDRVILNEDDVLLTLSALQIEPRFLLYKSSRIPLIISAGSLIKIPVNISSHDLLSGGVDAALRIYSDFDIHRFSFHASAGAAYLSTPGFARAAEFRNFVVPFFFSAEWQLLHDLFLVGTINGMTSPFETGYIRADTFSSTLTFGTRIEIGPQSAMEVSMSQEFLTFAATDVALNLVFSKSLMD